MCAQATSKTIKNDLNPIFEEDFVITSTSVTKNSQARVNRVSLTCAVLPIGLPCLLVDSTRRMVSKLKCADRRRWS